MTNTDNFNFDAFSHGQIKSKIWLCERLEPFLPINSQIAVLGSWYNILGFMLMVRGNHNIKNLTGFDIDPSAIKVANKICDYGIIENNNVKNVLLDVNTSTMDKYNVIINCSSEHMESSNWFNLIPKNTLVCIQSSSMTDPNEPWLIKNPSKSISDFLSKYSLSRILFLDSLPIRYNDWGYDRFMLIGIK